MLGDGNGSDPDISLGVDSFDVVLTRSETRRLIAAIEGLGSSNLRLITESRAIRKLVVAVILMTATFLGGFAIALWHQRVLNADLRVHAELQLETTDRLTSLLEGVCTGHQRGREPPSVAVGATTPTPGQSASSQPLRLLIDLPLPKDASVD